MKKFTSPHDVPVIPGTEGWERMYPYYYRFIPKGIDSKMEEYEDSEFWFIDNLHQTEVLLPFESIVDDCWWPSLNQISSRVVAFPTSRGLDHRMLNGWVYLCSPEETDPDVIAAKAAVVGDRMNYYFQNWDEILTVWKKKQYDNAKELDSISFDKLPDLVSDAYVRKNLGYSPAHVMRMDYFKLLKVVDLCWEQHFELLNVGLAAYLSFSDLCKKLFPDITDKTIGMMVASGAAYDSYLPEAKLEELCRLAIDLGLENHILKAGNADEVEARLAETEAGRKWQSERDKYRDPYFYVGTGYSVVTHKDRCWNDDWNIPLVILREYIGQMVRGEFVRRDIDAKKRECDALVEQYRSVLNENDKGMFDQLLPLARRGADHSESHMFWGETQYQPRQFNKLRQLGQLFCQYEMMDEPNDLFYFNRWEIPALIQDLTNAWATRTRPCGTWHMKRELAWRKDVIKKFREWDAPPFLGKPAKKVSDPFAIGLWGITTESVQNYLEGGEIKPEDLTELKGFQASPGVVEGRARVLSSHNDIDQIEKDEILVVTLTSPTWGPAFAKIAACITDIGGMMSHAAIICREYGIPAVIGTGYATKSIKTGDLLRVDGDRGVIKIVERKNS